MRAEQPLKGIIEAQGGNWQDFESAWKIVSAQVGSLQVNATMTTVREQITPVLNTAEPRLTRDISQRLRDASRFQDGWISVKQGGIGAVPQGQASQAAKRLIEAVKNLGVFVVKVGVLEPWATSVSRQGPRWVNEALKEGAHTTEPPRQFVVQVLDYFA